MISKSYASIRQIFPCLSAIIIDCLGWGLVYPIITALFTDPSSGITTPQHRNFNLGLGYLFYPFFMLFGTSFMGDLSDHFGRKKIIAFCMLGISVSFLFMGVGVMISSLTLFFIGRALSGLMAGSQPIAQAAVADLSSPETKAHHMSLMTFVTCIGLILGPLIGGVFSNPKISASFGLATPFFISAGLALATCGWIVGGFSETYVATHKKRLSVTRPIVILIKAFHHPLLRFLIPIFALMQIGFGLFFTLIFLHLKESFGYTSFQLGLFSGFIGLSLALGTLGVTPFCLNKWSVNKLAATFLCLTAFFEVWSGLNRNEVMTWVLALPCSLSNVVAYAMLMTTFSNAGNKDSQGWVMGIFGATVAVSFTLAGASPNLLSFVGIRSLIILGGIFVGIGGLGMALFSRRLKD